MRISALWAFLAIIALGAVACSQSGLLPAVPFRSQIISARSSSPSYSAQTHHRISVPYIIDIPKERGRAVVIRALHGGLSARMWRTLGLTIRTPNGPISSPQQIGHPVSIEGKDDRTRSPLPFKP